MSTEKDKRIAHIVQKGKTVERQIQALRDFLAGDSPDPTNAKLRSTNLSSLFNEYSRNIDELANLQSDHPQIAALPEVENNYYQVVSAVRKLQGAEPSAQSTLLNTSNLTFTEQNDLPKLPEIRVATFSGDQNEWVAWKHSFVALVHERPNTSNFVKHSLLIGYLSGLAKGIIKHLPPSEANYSIVWKELCNAFDQKRIVINEHIDAILTLPKLFEAKEDSLSNLLSLARQHVNMLKQLDIVVNEEFMIRILERCLPTSVVSRWQDRLVANKLPKLDELFSFIQNTIFSLHQLGTLPSSSRKRPADKSNHAKSKVAKHEARSLVTTTADDKKHSKKSSPKCNEAHHLFVCPIFRDKMQHQEKRTFVNQNKLCRNCLYAHTFPYKSDKRCKTCGKAHHTLLHADKGSKSSDNTSNGANASSSSTPQS
ncbi:uncharacterized protein LOC131670068 [Phymastichus coffea]|uniref:uncharacterized protein LOC131670068 n=1 Tax=Phymastichus coffea TaxID=108790 RepID=UPI00273B3148|nr:uncharacterized protein LOC131670068 [Phymastichus coffea]